MHPEEYSPWTDYARKLLVGHYTLLLGGSMEGKLLLIVYVADDNRDHDQ